MRGKPRNLDHSARPVKITIRTEPLFSDLEHDVFFNRGVASSQAYASKFENKKPDALVPPKDEQAREWLSRKLDDALLRFIRQARANDGLLCCFYEFRYAPAAQALREAIDRGVDLRLIVDAKNNETTDKKGVFHPLERVVQRTARKNDIQHNKFMVLLKGKRRTPTQVWTSSTNLSDGGIHGHECRALGAQRSGRCELCGVLGIVERSVTEATKNAPNAEGNLFLSEKPEEWLSKYKPGSLKQKRVDLYTGMSGFA